MPPAGAATAERRGEVVHMIDKKIRITDIARMANVSASTVSRVLNRNPAVSAGTREAVCQAMESLGMPLPSGIKTQMSRDMYKPHRNSKVIIVIVPGRNELFHADILHGVIDSATAHGFHVVSYRDLPTVANALEFIDMLKTLHVQGIISAVYLDKELLWMLADSFPVVQCCEYSDDKISYVSFDDWTGTKNAIEHLLSLGKRNIAIINTNLRHRFARHRQEGFMAAMDAAKIIVPANWIVNLTQAEYETVASAAIQLLTSSTKPDAIFASSDMMAYAVIDVAHKLNISIPEDLAVIGFDDISFSSIINPALTTLRIPRYQIGYTSAEMLFDKISQLNNVDKNIVFSVKLVIRESTVKRDQSNAVFFSDHRGDIA